jgi:hypothetical protein
VEKLTKLNGGKTNMNRTETLIISPDKVWDKTKLKSALAKKIDVNAEDISFCIVKRRSIDARKSVLYNVLVEYGLGKEKPKTEKFASDFKNVEHSESVLIVGAGPAGYFAALKLLSLGIKPVILERGKPVEERKFDISALHRDQILNRNSNYAFGEGGAGTYSDGKLYSRSKRKHDVNDVLNLFHHFGAVPDILIDTHPHIGTDKLSSIIKNLRNTIIEFGGEVIFNSCVTDIIVEDNMFKSVITENDIEYNAKAIIWATGHSATESYHLLQHRNIPIEAKGFAMGVRIEHPQELIDKIRYGRERGKYLPAAAYAIVCQQKGRGVYSFCMCPGGTIVPALTDVNTRVVNGMSNSYRNSNYANSGLVVEIRREDLPEQDSLAGLRYQQSLEQQAALNSGNGLIAPAQALGDFVDGKISSYLPKNSYSPGTVSSPIHFWMPEHISTRLKLALKYFGKRMPGFVTNDAIMLGVESKTSSPVRIIRDSVSLMSPKCQGFFPAGEGAGYAGGIMSSAIDGRRIAEKAAEFVS